MKRTHKISFNSNDYIQEDNDDNHNHNLSHNRGKNSSKGHYNHLYEGLITWPPKNYTCSFCKREFKSAQALGGHMNVHRRDRAKLRQPPSWLLESHHLSMVPNPNPNFPSPYSPSSSNFLAPQATFCKPSSTQKTRFDLSNPNYGDLTKEKNKRAVPCTREFKDTIAAYRAGKCDLAKDLKKKVAGEVISLELEMGLKDPKQVLDLELRLGYFN